VHDIPAGYGNVDNLFLQCIKARPLKTATHENVKCTDDLSCVPLKYSLGAETRAEQNHSPELPLSCCIHGIVAIFLLPLYFHIVKGRVTREVRK
jgi:hypothetical protein